MRIWTTFVTDFTYVQEEVNYQKDEYETEQKVNTIKMLIDVMFF